jgi:hypothetical protein
MGAYRPIVIGSVGFVSEILPFFTRGYGFFYKVGQIYQAYGEEGQRNLKIEKDLFHRWEESPETVGGIEEVGEKLAAL